VERVCSRAYESGLDVTSLEKLIDILTEPNTLDQGALGNIIKNLYPASKVSDGIIIKVLGSLGHGRAKPFFTTQVALLKWLVMVYDVLENQRVLSRFYGILFNLLDTLSIRYILFACSKEILTILGIKYVMYCPLSHDVNTSDHSEFKSCGSIHLKRSCKILYRQC
jgi:centromere protein I